ncbi:MAG: 16S rRNA (cytidine(1402)-2'-O)-methyltransferase [Longimicrobiaceae bacterium]
MATLYLVSTPIGNLADLSERAREVLNSADKILAEDTRRGRVLLNRYGVATRPVSAHRHNERARAELVVGWLEEGKDVALISDAGTPLVSDPGARIVRRVIGAGFPVVPVPGPSAVLAALAGSGLPADRFTFFGFAPRSGQERKRFLAEATAVRHTVVIYEAANRLVRLLEDLVEVTGAGRRVAVARELTKVHEEFVRGGVSEVAGHFSANPPRGEVVLVMEGAPPEATGRDEEQASVLATELLAEGHSPRSAAREVARRLGISRNRAYEIALAAQEEKG